MEHTEQHEIDDNRKVLIAKGVTMVVLCVVSIVMGLIPIQISRYFTLHSKDNPRSSRIVRLLLGFGGGVLFCTTFLHMLPEVSANVRELQEKGYLSNDKYSYAEMFACAGFFIMYLVEEIVQRRLKHHQEAISSHDDVKKNVNSSTNELVENGQVCPVTVHNHSHSHSHSHSYGHGHTHLPVAVKTDNRQEFVINSLRGLLIVLGLSVHELFEGLAVGLEDSSDHVWYMFGAVAAHKFVIAFCIGVELIATKTHMYLSILYVCTFAIMSPLGIGIGMALVGGSNTATGLLPVVLQGIATGTLLYVVFFEILEHNRTGLDQYCSILVGFLMMFGIISLRFLN